MSSHGAGTLAVWAAPCRDLNDSRNNVIAIRGADWCQKN